MSLTHLSSLRLARVALHVATGLALTASVLPLCDACRRARIRMWWSARLLRTLGVTLRHAGALPHGSLVVANHVSWLDVFAIGAQRPLRFVCKSDVREWPLIGWLVARNEAIFIERGSRSAATRANRAIVAALEAGESVVVFPEGTSSDGACVLPFHAATFQSAVDAGCAVIPTALRYVDASGARSAAAAYCGDIGFAQSLRAIAAADGLAVELEALAPLDAGVSDRRRLARQAHEAITSRLARRSGDTSTEMPSCLRAAPPSGSRPTGSPNPARAAFLRV